MQQNLKFFYIINRNFERQKLFQFKNSFRVQLTAKVHGFSSPNFGCTLFAVTEWFYSEFFCFYSNTSIAAFIPCVISSDVQDLKPVSAKKKKKNQQGFPSFTNLMCTSTHSTKDLSMAPLSSTVISLPFCVHF